MIPKITEASSLGAGIVAAIGAGWFETFNEAADSMTGIKKVIKPNEENHKKYLQLYKMYRKIYPSLRFFNNIID